MGISDIRCLRCSMSWICCKHRASSSFSLPETWAAVVVSKEERGNEKAHAFRHQTRSLCSQKQPKLLLESCSVNSDLRHMQEFPKLSRTGLSLLNGLLTYDPGKRLTARQALRHPWFSEAPLAKSPQEMPFFPSAHDADANDDQHRKSVLPDLQSLHVTQNLLTNVFQVVQQAYGLGLSETLGNHLYLSGLLRKEKKREDYGFRRQFIEKPSIIPG